MVSCTNYFTRIEGTAVVLFLLVELLFFTHCHVWCSLVRIDILTKYLVILCLFIFRLDVFPYFVKTTGYWWETQSFRQCYKLEEEEEALLLITQKLKLYNG
jgi:hypothetical protein